MATFHGLLVNVILFFLLMIPGYIMGKCKHIEEGAMLTLSNLLSDVAMPALVFSKLLEVNLLSVSFPTLVCCILMPFITVLLLYAIVTWVFRKPQCDAASRFCALFSNCGFLGIPLACAIFPDQPEVAVYVSVFNVFSTFLLLTLGTGILSQDKRAVRPLGILCSPITVALVLGCIGSYFRVGEYVTQIATYANTLAQLTTPLSMVVLGYHFSKLPFQKILCNSRVYSVAFFKLLVMPLLAMGVLVLVDLIPDVNVSGELAVAMLLATGVSTAASAPAMARKYGQDDGYAAALTLGNTMLCLITLPLIYLLFEAVFHL